MAEELADQTSEIETGVIGADAPDPVVVDATPDKEAKKPTLRETLNASVEEVRKAERTRDEKGKFAPDKEIKAAAEKPAPEIPTPEKDAQPKAASTPAGPPPGWSAESKAFYATLPVDHPLRKDIEKREAEVSSGFKKYSDDSKRYQEIEQALAPVRPAFQQAGIRSDAEAIKNLLGWENSFRNPASRVQAFHNLARQYGVDLSQLVQGSPELSNAGDIPAHLRPVIDQFGAISQDVTALKGELQRRDQERVTAELSAFAKDKPHFEKVRVSMGKLMAGGLVDPTDLDGAYQKAIGLDPELSASLAAEKEAARQAELQKQQADKAKQARIAAVSPSIRAPSGPVVNGVKAAKSGARGSILAAIEQLRGDQRA